MAPIYRSVVEAVGRTPLVGLQNITAGMGPELLVKLECLNPGGSSKDRPLVRMIEEAEERGELARGDTILDSSSGNFAVAMAMAGAAKGYRVVCVVDPKLTRVMRDILSSLGAELVFATQKDGTGSYLRDRLKLRKQMLNENPGCWCPDQYRNAASIRAHYYGTGAEIVSDVEGRLDVLVIATGTGGTITGCARCVKEHIPNVRVVAADAFGSKIFDDEIHPWMQMGVGSGLNAEELDNLDLELIDEVRLVGDEEAFLTARALARCEGIMAGGSSGCALFAALTLIEDLSPDARLVAILPDRMERYLSEHQSDSWLQERGFTLDASSEAVWKAVAAWRRNELVSQRAGGLPIHKACPEDGASNSEALGPTAESAAR